MWAVRVPGNDACARGGDTKRTASQLPSPLPSTTATRGRRQWSTRAGRWRRRARTQPCGDRWLLHRGRRSSLSTMNRTLVGCGQEPCLSFLSRRQHSHDRRRALSSVVAASGRRSTAARRTGALLAARFAVPVPSRQVDVEG